MKKSFRGTFSINFGTFPGNVAVCVGVKYKDIIRQYKKEKLKGYIKAIKHDKDLIDNCYGLAIHRAYKKKNYYYIILKEPFAFKDEQYMTLTHELLHVIQFHLPDILDRNREYEAEAYTLNHLTRQCLKVFRKHAKK